MTILFPHGWNSVPGGIKPTFSAKHGHTVINPALPLQETVPKHFFLIGIRPPRGTGLGSPRRRR